MFGVEQYKTKREKKSCAGIIYNKGSFSIFVASLVHSMHVYIVDIFFRRNFLDSRANVAEYSASVFVVVWRLNSVVKLNGYDFFELEAK